MTKQQMIDQLKAVNQAIANTISDEDFDWGKGEDLVMK